MRRGALTALAATMLLGTAGLGSARPAQVSHPRAVLQPALRHTIEAALAKHRAPAIQVIVTGWDRNSLKALDGLKVRHRHLSTLPMAFAKLTPRQIVRMLNAKNIRSVYGVESFKLMLDESAKLIGARYAADVLKADGTGSVIAVVDTGIDTTHMDLDEGKVLHNYEVLAPNINDAGSPLLVESPMSDDDEHGTHVAGTIAGSGDLARSDSTYSGKDLRGIAPGAKLIGYSANQGPTLLSTHTIAAFDHIIATRNETHVRAISNSWGGSGGANFDPNNPISVAQESAWRAGIVPVFAAGNSGSPGDTTATGLDTLSSQCVSPFVVCVAAMTKHRQVATFSSKGRSEGNFDRAVAQRFHVGLYRPAVTAPGVNITAPAAISSHDGDKPHGYLTMSGTSMSTPEVSGVIALVTSANSKLTPAQIVRILESTADPLPGWSAWEDGAGAVNARKAVQVALAMKAGRTVRLPAPKLSYASPAHVSKVIARFDGTALPASYVHHSGVTDHHFTVPAGTERVDVQLSWDLPVENMYAFIWEPGVTPNDDNPSGAPFASQETWGLLCDGPAPENPCMLTGRKASIRFPKPGDWTMRVFGRTLAADYTATVTAAEFTLPSTTASIVNGILSGKANLPGSDQRRVTYSPLAGTAPDAKNPTERPFPVYFHDESPLPVAGSSVESPTWDATKPTGDTPKFWTGVAGGFLDQFDVLEQPFFKGVAPKDSQGTLIATIWAGQTVSGAGIFGQWDVSVYRGDETEPFATGSVSGAGLSEVPSRIDIPVPAFEVKKGTPLTFVFNAPFINEGTHSALYFDSVDMPSGVVFPSVSKLITRGALHVADAVLGEVTGAGAATLSWTRVDGATAYRVYEGRTPDAIKPAFRLAQVAKPRGARSMGLPPVTISGDIVAGNPVGGPLWGATETNFQLTCPDEPDLQGVDGYVFTIPAESRDGRQKISVKGTADTIYDLDVHLYDASCTAMTGYEEDLAGEDADESGTLPAGAAYGVISEFVGGPTSFTATMTRATAATAPKVPHVQKTITGLHADQPVYFRVSAIDSAGREGPLSDVLVTVPSRFDRGIDVSVDGSSWRTVPVAADGSWSIPVSALRSGIGAAAPALMTIKVRARAGEATGPVKTLTAAGGFTNPGPGTLPSTGVGDGMLGLALLAAAAGLGVRSRRRAAI